MADSVLIVDEDDFTREMLMKRLSREGHLVSQARDVDAACLEIEKSPPDLVISGMELDQSSGLDLCRIISANTALRPIHVIMLTSCDTEEDIVRSLQAGADEYLVKPINVQELIARVAAGLRVVRLQKDLSATNNTLNDALSQIEKELQIVADIQRSLLPQDLPRSEAISLAAYYRPSTQCGGDYYDALPLGDDLFALTIADVSGHGTPAMVAMALIRLLVHTHASKSLTPAELLALLNSELYKHLPTQQYATMFYAILDSNSGRMTYSSAGQPPPFLYRAETEKIACLENCEGFPLKLVTPDADYENSTIQLRPGDNMMLFTDGANEMLNGKTQLFGIERLSKTLLECSQACAQKRIEYLVDSLDEFADGEPQSDDVTLLAIDILKQG